MIKNKDNWTLKKAMRAGWDVRWSYMYVMSHSPPQLTVLSTSGYDFLISSVIQCVVQSFMGDAQSTDWRTFSFLIWLCLVTNFFFFLISQSRIIKTIVHLWSIATLSFITPIDVCGVQNTTRVRSFLCAINHYHEFSSASIHCGYIYAFLNSQMEYTASSQFTDTEEESLLRELPDITKTPAAKKSYYSTAASGNCFISQEGRPTCKTRNLKEPPIEDSSLKTNSTKPTRKSKWNVNSNKKNPIGVH